MADLLPADWEDQVVRAYTVFGIEPSLDEFGFGFPRMPTSFLRSKAMRQLRDKFGKWREQRATIAKPDGDSTDKPDGDSTVRVTSRLREPPAVDRFAEEDAATSFEEPGDTSVEDIEYHIARRDREQQRHQNALKAWEDGGRDGPEPQKSEWLQAYEKFEADDDDGPRYQGTPEERLAYARFLKEKEDRKEVEIEQEKWDWMYRGKEPWHYKPLDALGATQPPTLLGKEEFDAFKGLNIDGQGTDTVYRGVKAGPEGTSARQMQAATQLAPAEEHYIGNGIAGDGLYFGSFGTAGPYGGLTQEQVAAGPPDELPMGQEAALVRAKLHPDTKMIDFSRIEPEMQKEIDAKLRELGYDPKTIDTYELDRIMEEAGMTRVPDIWAMQHGYDVIINGITSGYININVVNRARLIMEELGLEYTPPPPRPVLPPLEEVPEPKRRGSGFPRDSKERRARWGRSDFLV